MTIVEVLMVVFIIGLTAGIVTLTIPQRPTLEQAEAQAFAKVLRDAQDQAIMTGQPVGLRLSETGYSVVQWQRERWLVRGRPEQLPPRLDIVAQEDRAERPDGWPDLVFDPTGIVEPAVFELRGRGARIDISLNALGEVNLVER
jgi:type II secretion system protein H